MITFNGNIDKQDYLLSSEIMYYSLCLSLKECVIGFLSSGFEWNFWCCIVKNSHKISLVLGLPKHTMVRPEGQKMLKFCML